MTNPYKKKITDITEELKQNEISNLENDKGTLSGKVEGKDITWRFLNGQVSMLTYNVKESAINVYEPKGELYSILLKLSQKANVKINC